MYALSSVCLPFDHGLCFFAYKTWQPRAITSICFSPCCSLHFIEIRHCNPHLQATTQSVNNRRSRRNNCTAPRGTRTPKHRLGHTHIDVPGRKSTDPSSMCGICHPGWLCVVSSRHIFSNVGRTWHGTCATNGDSDLMQPLVASRVWLLASWWRGRSGVTEVSYLAHSLNVQPGLAKRSIPLSIVWISLSSIIHICKNLFLLFSLETML
jgi:hypothetical protein